MKQKVKDYLESKLINSVANKLLGNTIQDIDAWMEGYESYLSVKFDDSEKFYDDSNAYAAFKKLCLPLGIDVIDIRELSYPMVKKNGHKDLVEEIWVEFAEGTRSSDSF